MMTKKTVLITGCSEGGLGAALANVFHDQDFYVFATVRDPAKATSLGRENIEILPLDVTSQSTITECLEVVKKRTGGKLDVLVNNAGALFFGPLLDVSIEDAKSLFDSNVWGMLAVSQAFSPLLIEAKGVMVNICSIAGAVRMAWQGIYNSSKAAETWFSETLRIELEPLGVRVMTVMLGEVESKIYTKKQTFHLPENSYYRCIEDIIAKQSSGAMQTSNEQPDMVARNLVQDVLKGRKGQVWRGGVAGTAKYASWLLPTRLFEIILHNSRGVYHVK